MRVNIIVMLGSYIFILLNIPPVYSEGIANTILLKITYARFN